jgi:hypothetical protein
MFSLKSHASHETATDRGRRRGEADRDRTVNRNRRQFLSRSTLAVAGCAALGTGCVTSGGATGSKVMTVA